MIRVDSLIPARVANFPTKKASGLKFESQSRITVLILEAIEAPDAIEAQISVSLRSMTFSEPLPFHAYPTYSFENNNSEKNQVLKILDDYLSFLW